MLITQIRNNTFRNTNLVLEKRKQHLVLHAHVQLEIGHEFIEESLVPLKKVMIEHNAHEEAVFRKVGSSSLLEKRDEILARMSAVGTEKSQRKWGF